MPLTRIYLKIWKINEFSEKVVQSIASPLTRLFHYTRRRAEEFTNSGVPRESFLKVIFQFAWPFSGFKTLFPMSSAIHISASFIAPQCYSLIFRSRLSSALSSRSVLFNSFSTRSSQFPVGFSWLRSSSLTLNQVSFCNVKVKWFLQVNFLGFFTYKKNYIPWALIPCMETK